MKETRYFHVPDVATSGELPQDEAVHAVRVLRLKEGDEVMLMDGKGCFYEAVITLASNHHCAYNVTHMLPQQRAWKGRLHVAVGPTKMMERMEWFAEKATEMGVDKITFLDCQFSERRTLKSERIEKIVVAAVKQSRKAWVPDVEGLVAFKDFVRIHTTGLRFIAHCYEEVERVNLFDTLRKCFAEQLSSADEHESQPQEVLVMIGPEGDFSIDEVRMAVEAGFISVDLGKSRLRTETAALSAVMMMQLAQRLSKGS